jgi:hypothetical protein
VNTKSPPHLAWASWIRDIAHAGGTGGLNWHVHALRSLNRWLPTRERIAQFLAGIEPRQKHLLLIGPSAGWMLPTPWLTRFQQIDVFDIDPLVPLLFGLRHGKVLREHGTQMRFHRQDAIAGLPQLLRAHPNACLWFDNVLGQVSVRLGDEDMAERQLSHLKQLMQGRSWGSLHDVYSGPVDPDMALPLVQTHAFKRLNAQSDDSAQVELDGRIQSLDTAAQSLLTRLNAKGVWHDHATSGVFAPNTPTTLMAWAFKPYYWHWLEAGWVNSSN